MPRLQKYDEYNQSAKKKFPSLHFDSSLRSESISQSTQSRKEDIKLPQLIATKQNVSTFNLHSSTRFSNIGSLFSGLSKSKILKKKTENPRKIAQLRNRKQDKLYQSRVHKIKAMKKAYMKVQDEETNANHKNEEKSQYLTEKARKSSMNNRKEIGGAKDPSMRELLDWLENLDLNKVNEF
jgi:hypothetical protein